MSAEAIHLWDNLLTVADDYGIFEADPEVCCSLAFPRKPSWLKGGEKQVGKLLDELGSDGEDGDPAPVLFYHVGRTRFGIFRPDGAWRKSQGKPRADKPKHPLPKGVSMSDLLRADERTCAQLKSDVLASASASAYDLRSHSDADDEDEPAKEKPNGQVQAIFLYWKEKCGRPRAKLGKKRKARIEWALREYGEEDARKAIDGCAASAFHMGDNNEGKRYNDLTLIFRDEPKIESFLERPVGPPQEEVRRF